MDEELQRNDDGEPTLEGCFAPDGTDLTLIQWALEVTPGQRLRTAQSIVDLVAAGPSKNDDEFLALLRAVADRGVEFVVVGSLAAILQGVPISIVDVAVVYQADSANLDRLLTALLEVGATYRDPACRSIKPNVKRLMTNRINLLQGPASILDVMREITPGWAYEDLIERSHEVELSGMNLRVLDLAAVVESKEASDCPLDQAVLYALRKAAYMS